MKNCILFFLLTSVLSAQEVENFKYFSVGYDEMGTHWVSYRLTSDMIEGDTSRTRESFKSFNSKKTSDYTNSGYDRGHLAAADSFSFDQEAYSETFSLANIAPMKPSLNRQVWKWLEVYEKRLAQEEKCINVRIDVVYGIESVSFRSLSIPTKFIRTIDRCDGKNLGIYEFFNIE